MKTNFCPECQRLGLKSILYVGGKSGTLMGGSQWYDYNGEFHDHDSNTITQAFWCSQEHYGEFKTFKACPGCDFKREEDTYILREDGGI